MLKDLNEGTGMNILQHPFSGRQRGLLAAAALMCLIFPATASATWSIVAVDSSTGQVAVASATCLLQSVFPRLGAKDLRDIQAVVVAGKGGAVGQALIDTARANQKILRAEVEKATDPAEILQRLRQADPQMETRQFGIVDVQGRSAGFTGKENQPRALSVGGSAGPIRYQVQGNILASDDVVHEAVRALSQGRGTLAARVMAAMEAADARGGDRRCTGGKTAHVAYLLVVEKDGKETYIRATDEDPGNPIRVLRTRFDASKKF
jgi:uncharacterized Ntn-hydrolase superfamily protein